ncbi:MAG TPA: universal stress protein [Burkholderiales bacterium]|nr:universal stress protein [Burkholderiales bacterium]
MFKRILVPVDGSRTSWLGLDKAIRLAREQRATLCLLHVVDERVTTQYFEGGAAAIDRLLDSLLEGGKRVLARAEAKARKQRVRVKTVLVENVIRSVADVIVGQARKWRADLIVIGTHGRRGVSRLVMGSDAEGVVRTTPVPVLLVRSKAGRQR